MHVMNKGKPEPGVVRIFIIAIRKHVRLRWYGSACAKESVDPSQGPRNDTNTSTSPKY